jgi:predicted PurR-regulated permease PerM
VSARRADTTSHIGSATPPTDPSDRTRTLRIDVTLRSVLTVAGVLLGWWLLAQVWEVVLALVFALVLAGTFNPLVNRLEARRVPRPLALLAIILGLLATVAGIVALIVPGFSAQLSALAESAPAMQGRLADFLAASPFAAQADAVRHGTPDQVVSPMLPGALPFASRIAEVTALAATSFVLAFYLIADSERMLGFAYALLPRRLHVRVARVLLDMEVVVGGYVRGQALTSLFCGLFFFIVLTASGTPNALALAIFAAFADLLPFFGGYLAMTPALLATLSEGWVRVLIVLAAIVAYQEFESRVLVPRIYGRTLRLSPVAVIVALLIGAKLLGVVGALLALPIAAGIRVLVQDLRIELPGEVTGEQTERHQERQAESAYAERTEGATAVRAAQVATEIAQRLPSANQTPVEDRHDAA